MTAEQREKLFNYMHDEHGVTLLESDMDEIDNIVNPKTFPFMVLDDMSSGNIPGGLSAMLAARLKPKLFQISKPSVRIIKTPNSDFLTKFRPDPKPVKVEKVKKQYKFIKKATGEAAIFKKIWEERPHVSQISGEPIHEPKPINFLHVLAKGQNKYPEFKLLEQNIVLGTEAEHHIWDNARHLISTRNDETKHYNWKMMLELEESLKLQYKEKFV